MCVYMYLNYSIFSGMKYNCICVFVTLLKVKACVVFRKESPE